MSNFKRYFEENLLDGDSIDDCGKSRVDAKEVYEVVSQYISARDAEWVKVVEGIQVQKLDMASAIHIRIGHNDCCDMWNRLKAEALKKMEVGE